MKNVVASSIVTGLLIVNLVFAVFISSSSGQWFLVFGQGIWLVASFLWLSWALRRYRRLHGQEKRSSGEVTN